MSFIPLQRVTRAIHVLGLLGACLLTAATSSAQTTYQITNWDGTIVPAAAHLYTAQVQCYNSSSLPPATICSFVVRRLYGSQSAVVVVMDYPNGSEPGCYNGVTQQIDSGYSRSSCAIFATAAVYGTN